MGQLLVIIVNIVTIYLILLIIISITGGEDYNIPQQSILIPAGSTSSLYGGSIINDMIHEDDETFNITISLQATCLPISVDRSVATVTIHDDEGDKKNMLYS